MNPGNRTGLCRIGIDAKYSPEGAAADGVRGLEEQIFSLAADQRGRERADFSKARQELAGRLAYVGMTPGDTPFVDQAERRFRGKLKNPALLGPSKAEVEKDLENTSAYATGIGLLLEKYKIEGCEPAYAKLKEQLAAYDDFVRREVLPKARADFRLPPAVYAISLDAYGVDFTPADLERMGHKSFTEIQAQMQDLAAKVAKERGFTATDYRSVIRQLKKEQLKGDEVLPHYQHRLAEIEGIPRANHPIALPERSSGLPLRRHGTQVRRFQLRRCFLDHDRP